MLERGVVQYETFSGVTLLVTPLSVVTHVAIEARVREELPDFDETPYHLPIPESAIEGATFLDEDNPEYQQKQRDLTRQRNERMRDLIFELAIEIKDRDAVVSAYKDRLAKLKKLLALKQDDGYILLHHIALTRQTDYDHVARIFNDRAPITMEEVADGMRIFRAELPGNGPLAAYGKPSGAANQPTG